MRGSELARDRFGQTAQAARAGAVLGNHKELPPRRKACPGNVLPGLCKRQPWRLRRTSSLFQIYAAPELSFTWPSSHAWLLRRPLNNPTPATMRM